MANRPREQVETRLVAEWLREHRSAYWFQTRVRLGALPGELDSPTLDDAERRLVHGAFARWADAIVELPDRTELIEAKIIAHPEAIAQLELYARLLPETPSLSHRKTMPVQRVMLYAVPDPMVIEMARERSIIPIEYTPTWVNEYLARRLPRHRAAPLDQRSAAVQEVLGS